MINTPNWPSLKNGDSGTNVLALRCLLNYRSNNGALALTNNSFDPIVYAAVRDFQASNNLSVNGVVDSSTFLKLITDVSKGAKNYAAKAAQYLLSKFETLAIDGEAGDITELKTRAFNRRMEISGSGTVDPTTWKYLFGYASYPDFIYPSGYSLGQPVLTTSEFIHRDSIDLLARVIYGEASPPTSATPTNEQIGVAYAVHNRKANGSWGSTFVAVILANSQFNSMEGVNKTTQNPDLTSNKWKASLSAAQTYTTKANPIGTRMFFVKKGTSMGTGYTNKLTIGETDFYDGKP